MINLTPLFNAFIAVVAALLARYLVPWLKERTTAARREDLSYWVKVCVKAAEQLYGASQGGAKKDYVLGFLSDKGFTVDADELNNAIEAAVLELHRGLADG